MDSNQQKPFESEGSRLAETLLDAFRKLNDHFWCELTSKDLWNCYRSFSEGLKELRGTSAGFTGLTELLVFRCLY